MVLLWYVVVPSSSNKPKILGILVASSNCLFPKIFRQNCSISSKTLAQKAWYFWVCAKSFAFAKSTESVVLELIRFAGIYSKYACKNTRGVNVFECSKSNALDSFFIDSRLKP